MLVIAGGGGLSAAYASSSVFALLLGVTLILAGTLGVFFGLWHILKRKPYLIIDGEGIHFRQQTTVFIPWSEIIGGEVVLQNGLLFLMLDLVNIDDIAGYQSLAQFKDLAENTHFDQVKPLPANSLPIPLFGQDVRRELVLEVVVRNTKTHKTL
ncbi:MAG: hypothetical protein HY289_01950 [Planctomycetes bacterium]|nr:hypothetical protein [Planctomycetota bacterium]